MVCAVSHASTGHNLTVHMPNIEQGVIDPRHLRNALGRFATGVTIITTRTAGGTPPQVWKTTGYNFGANLTPTWTKVLDGSTGGAWFDVRWGHWVHENHVFLIEYGLKVYPDNARKAYPQLSYGESAIDVARDADVVVLLTEWAEFRELDPAAMGEIVNQKRIVDGRHALDPVTWRAAGWEYRALGRP